MKPVLHFLLQMFSSHRFVRIGLLFVVASSVCPLLAQQSATGPTNASYAVGIVFGNGFLKEGFEMNVDEVARGMRDALSGNTNVMMEPEARKIIQAYRTALSVKAEKQRMDEAAKNRKLGEAFLATNKTREGVTTMPSGMQYRVITNGAGALLKTNDVIRVIRVGAFIDGKEFENYRSVRVPQMMILGRDHIIKGLREALGMMRIGDRWQIFIPADLAYKDTGWIGGIPPGATLIYDLEILEVTTIPTLYAPTNQSAKTN